MSRTLRQKEWRETPRFCFAVWIAVFALGYGAAGCRCAEAPRESPEEVDRGAGREPLQFRRLVLGPLKTNTYIIWKPPSRRALVLDPAAHARRVLNEAAALGLEIEAIGLTHNHFDHAGALRQLRNSTDATVFLHEAQLRASDSRIGVDLSGLDARLVPDGAKITAGGADFEIIYVPGHAPGNICFYISREPAAFCGDLLFAGNVGRVDLPGGSAMELKRSLAERIGEWSDATRIFPGHGETTELGRERRVQKVWFAR